MAPSRRKTTAKANPTRIIITRSIYKKQQQESSNKLKLLNSSGTEEAAAESAKSTSTTTINEDYYEKQETKSSCDEVVCSTPRGKKYTIPKISTCPPAPKKKRLVLNHPRAATKFFSHPELDVFFLFSSQ